MKAHEFFAGSDFSNEKVRTMMEKYSYLVEQKVKAESTNETLEDTVLEDEVFTIVGLTTKDYTTNIYAVLKSDECDIIVSVPVSKIDRPRDTYPYNPGFILKLMKE